MINVRRIAQRTRSVGERGTAGQPENGQHCRYHKVGQRQFTLVVIQIIGIRINESNEQAVEHRQHTGGHKEFGIRCNVHRYGNLSVGRLCAQHEFVGERIWYEMAFNGGRCSAGRCDFYRHINRCRKGTNGKNLLKKK